MMPYLRHLRTAFLGKRDHPLYLIYFVTSKCDAQCKHCFYWRSTNVPQNELSLTEIDKLAQSVGSLLQLTLTGGDACRREELPEIAAIFHRYTGVGNITIGTNGYRTETVVEQVGRMIDACNGANVTVDLSVDAMGEAHDAIRNCPGMFEHVSATLSELKKLQKHRPNLNLCVDITVSAFNQDCVLETYQYIRDVMKPDIINLLLIRGEPRDPEAKKVDLVRYREVNELLAKDVRRGLIRGYSFLTDVLNAKDILLRRVIIKTSEEGRFQLPCTAGGLTGVMYPEGDVYPCELSGRSFGNVRDFDYDFKKVWCGPRAEEERRRIISEKCYCIHQCFLSNNILFNPRTMPQLVREYARLKLSRLAVGGRAS